MDEASLVRTVRFSAGHRYGRPEWTEAENRKVYGVAAEPHAHEWTVEVTVRGPIDERTGFVVDLAALDERLDALVRGLDGGDLNQAIPEVREGSLVPSTEGLARWFWGRLVRDVPGEARLVRVRVAESDLLASEYEG